jgi:hypothetical protein
MPMSMTPDLSRMDDSIRGEREAVRESVRLKETRVQCAMREATLYLTEEIDLKIIRARKKRKSDAENLRLEGYIDALQEFRVMLAGHPLP